jgi:hypothetical protein
MTTRVAAFAALAAISISSAVRAEEPELVSPGQGNFSVGGYAELQLRALSDNFDVHDWYMSQWAWILNVEPEWDIAPEGWGPFDSISAFARIQVRYDCVWTGCGISNSWKHFGNRAKVAPARNWADGVTERFEGPIDLPSYGVPIRSLQPENDELLPATFSQHGSRGVEVGVPQATIDAAFGTLIDDVFTFKRIDAYGVNYIGDTIAPPLGPWRPESRIRPNGPLAYKPSHIEGLPMRPATDSIYVPSARLREQLDDFDSFDQNFRQTELEWNHGASQDEWELKEAYVDVDLFESRLWLRIGKQAIVWGKTELFRNQDQFNPVDVGLASLPSLEDSRIALWSARAVWSFYDVGPLADVRLELAANFDDFEPTDLGRCGEPYTPWLVCLKSTALWGHGLSGFGIAGEDKPPDPWDSSKGIEFGARLEFRWGPFSFAITDFYGYDDFASAELFNSYSRNVDPVTGRPLDTFGRPLDPDTALVNASGNRQFFEFSCEASLGFGSRAASALTGGEGVIPDLSQACQPGLTNFAEPFSIEAELAGFPVSIEASFPNATGVVLAGHDGGNLLFEAALNGIDSALNAFGNLPQHLTALNVDPADGVRGGGFFGADCTLGTLCDALGIATSNVSMYLSDQQEALLGCGPFYRTDCDVDGIDLFNAEASVLLQALSGFEHKPVGTRFSGNRVLMIPGSRGPGDKGYDRRIDGTPPRGFHSEMAALSDNFLKFTALVGIAEGDEGCTLEDINACATVRGLLVLTGSQRPELRAGGNGRFGRQDFLWHGGGEARLFYPKRNILGFAFDFAEDVTKTNWGVELTWIDDATFQSNTSRNLLQESDVYNLTVSVDRPTFVNFLNANRTFFFNAQIFVRYLPHYASRYDTDGPLTALGTFAITTGYLQDRLLPSIVFVHDLTSASGGVIFSTTYRFTESFSATMGVLGFYGGPQKNRTPLYPIALPYTQSNFTYRTRFDGLSAISERDEVYLTIRYTF